jgi:O-acetylserine/cysteine efflux transporter
MSIAHIALAVLIAAIWGFNFVAIKTGLESLSPLTFCFVRFFLASIPIIFFIKPPKVPFNIIALYGIFTFGGQFIFLFIGMKLGVTAGLASLLLQSQVFFTILFAIIFLKESINGWQIIGAFLAFSGIAHIGFKLHGSAFFLGFLLVIAAAISWGLGNLIVKTVKNVNMVALVVWGSFIAWPLLLLIAIVFDGPSKIIYDFRHISLLGSSAIFYIVYLSTLFGFGAWSWLIKKYSLVTVAPFALLVPIFGMASSALITGEPFQSWKIIGTALIIAGLSLGVLFRRFFIPHSNLHKAQILAGYK